MKKIVFYMTVVSLVLYYAGIVMAEESSVGEKGNGTSIQTVQSILSSIKLGGGISSGYFYTSNPGEDGDDDAFLLSNLLVELSSVDNPGPVGFSTAFGESSTPSILGTPENNTDFKIEYASVNIAPISGMALEMGLLQPNAGYESTYTYNNKNITLGAVASQQPYNAYGARISYDAGGITMWGGYYKDRLDDEEYNSPDYAWEAGVKTSIAGNDISLYDYHIHGQRNLLGMVVERTIDNLDLALNIDYWTWDDRIKSLYKDKSSMGGALYICPNIGRLSLPVRLEYIKQDGSRIYIDCGNTKKIYSATFSPTWHFNENAYVRAESAYISADHGFVNSDGIVKDGRTNIAIEAGFIF